MFRSIKHVNIIYYLWPKLFLVSKLVWYYLSQSLYTKEFNLSIELYSNLKVHSFEFSFQEQFFCVSFLILKTIYQLLVKKYNFW